MPVPKKRTTKSTKGQRRSHDAIKANELIVEKESGLKVPHKFQKAAKLGKLRYKKG